MIARREFILYLLGGLLFGKAAFSSELSPDSDKKILTDLSPYLIGLEKNEFLLSLKDIVIPRNIEKELSKVIAQYQKDDVFDQAAFMKDLESGKMKLSRSLSSFLHAQRNRAVISFYTSPHGLKLAGYEGPPMNGYPDYHVCK